jgi:hypothetical protein
MVDRSFRIAGLKSEDIIGRRVIYNMERQTHSGNPVLYYHLQLGWEMSKNNTIQNNIETPHVILIYA